MGSCRKRFIRANRGADSKGARFRVRIVASTRRSFRCGHNIPVVPDVSLSDDPKAEVVIVPEIWLGPDEKISGRHPALMNWLRDKHATGSTLYAACAGTIVLAETGLLDGRNATSHWAYWDLFRLQYPRVLFRPEPSLVFADPVGRIVTAGGATSWHDLALHIISRHANAAEALRIAKAYLLKLHDEGQLPFATLIRNEPHGDAVVRSCQEWLRTRFKQNDAITKVVAHAGNPERTLKRRFKVATGSTLIEQLQNLRVEHAKRFLEESSLPIDEISAEAGYEDASFFRRLFRRSTGLSPAQYRRIFQSLGAPSAPRQVRLRPR